mmetsp:Transcript_28301/g.36768  ORF Transcript_28301/g.36768 Transcript_28301/m.36768 type:complete len:289 (-) Transcript_28301:225-1091(-)
MSLRTARVTTGRTNRSDGHEERPNHTHVKTDRPISRGNLTPGTGRSNSYSYSSSRHPRSSRSQSVQYDRIKSPNIPESQRIKPYRGNQTIQNAWHRSLPHDHNPWDVGLDTQRIAHELEWDDKQLDEEGMTSARLGRAKAFAANHFVHNELHPNTIQATPEFSGLDRKSMVNVLSKSTAFGKQLRELKYKNRRLANKSSTAVVDCMTIDDPDRTGQFDFQPVETKPYSSGVLTQQSTGVRSLRELKYNRSMENIKAGQTWLARDQTYLRPGVNFRRVNAFMRDSYVSR